MRVQIEAQIVPITLVTQFWYIFVDQMEIGQKQEENGDIDIYVSWLPGGGTVRSQGSEVDRLPPEIFHLSWCGGFCG